MNTDVTLLPAGRREHHASLSIDPPRRGMYRLRIEAGDLQRELTFGVVPRPSRVGGAEDSIFGIHAILRNPHFPRLAEQMGMRWERLWGGNISDATLWSSVEPEPGAFEWRDEHIDLAREHGLSIVGMLGGRAPAWLEVPMGKWGDEELSAWRRYVRATVGHYRGRISHWEVLNEPYGGLRPDQADVYVRVLRAAREAAKEADPDCVIVGVCGPPSAGHWYEPVFEAGGLQYVDAVSAHLYPPGGGTAVLDFDEELRRQIAGIRELMGEYGEVKPLWDTEAGIGPATPFNRMRQPRYFSTYGRPVPIDVATDMTARLYIVHAIEDVRMFYYLLHGSYEYAYALCENDGPPLPACAALAVAESILDGARPVRSVANGSARCYAFRRRDRGIIAVWAIGLQGRRPTLAAELSPDEALDVMGNPAAATDADGRLTLTLTPSPVYLRMPASRLAEAVEALERAPEPELAPVGVQITGVHDELLGECVALDVHSFEAGATELTPAFEQLPRGWQAVEREGYGRRGEYVIHGGRRLLFPIERTADAERAGTVAVRATCGDAEAVATDTVELPDEPPSPGRPHRPGVEMSHTGVEQVTVRPWTVQTSTSGLQTLYAGDRPLLERFYFYVARHGLNQALVSFRGSERTTERSPDGASVVLSNETDRGSCTLTVRPTEDEVQMRWELHVEPVETGWGELGVYVPASMLNRGYPCRLEARLANGQTRERVLSAENHPVEAL
ncbi:MAG: endo-1,4-beta-xylanase, partial [Gemmatimonadota bacterium]|nr:endo-1,4-beta-xylanase [Gemmatimonadota bacterium]